MPPVAAVKGISLKREQNVTALEKSSPLGKATFADAYLRVSKEATTPATAMKAVESF